MLRAICLHVQSGFDVANFLTATAHFALSEAPGVLTILGRSGYVVIHELAVEHEHVRLVPVGLVLRLEDGAAHLPGTR